MGGRDRYLIKSTLGDTMPRIVRDGADLHYGHASPTPNPYHQTPYVSGQSKVKAMGRAVVRKGDATACGDPAVGCSSKVRAVGKFVHRKGDTTGGHGSWRPNAAKSGAPKVEVGS